MCGCCGPAQNGGHDPVVDEKIDTTGIEGDQKMTKSLRSAFNAFLKEKVLHNAD